MKSKLSKQMWSGNPNYTTNGIGHTLDCEQLHQVRNQKRISFGMIFLSIIFGMMPPMVCPVTYPLVNLQKTIEAMAIEIVDLPTKNGEFP